MNLKPRNSFFVQVYFVWRITEIWSMKLSRNQLSINSAFLSVTPPLHTAHPLGPPSHVASTKLRRCYCYWARFHQHFTRNFYAPDPQSAKKTDNFTVFFAFLGSAHVKALRKMLVKLTPVPCAVVCAFFRSKQTQSKVVFFAHFVFEIARLTINILLLNWRDQKNYRNKQTWSLLLST